MPSTTPKSPRKGSLLKYFVNKVSSDATVTQGLVTSRTHLTGLKYCQQYIDLYKVYLTILSVADTK
jgi:hypothetical protein